MRIVLAVLAALFLSYLGARLLGRQLHVRRAARAFDAVGARALADSSEADAIDATPAIVASYLSRALPEGAPSPAQVVLEQRGRFRLGPEADYLPLRARQRLRVTTPALAWVAEMRLLGQPLYVVDRLVDGRGHFGGHLLGLVAVAEGDGPETDVSTLLRYLAEAVWAPWALRPRRQLRWQEVDATHARASLTAAGRTVSGVFTFDADGRPLQFRTTERYGAFHGEMVRLPWRVELSHHRRFEGVEVPARGRIFWELGGGDFEVGHVDVEALRFEPRAEGGA